MTMIAATLFSGIGAPEVKRLIKERDQWADKYDDAMERIQKATAGGFGNAIVPQLAAEFIRAAT